MRIEALSRRVARLQDKAKARAAHSDEPATKRSRPDVEPPSTMKRMMNWVFGTGMKPPTVRRASPPRRARAQPTERRAKSPTPAVFTASASATGAANSMADTTAGFLQRVDETFDIGDVTMAATPLRPITMPAALERRSHTHMRMTSIGEGQASTSSSRPSVPEYPRPAPTEYRYGPSETSLYAPLYPSLPDRSAAIAPIVSGTPRPRVRVRSGDGSLMDKPIMPPPTAGRGVKDIARALEDSGKLELSFESARREKEKGRVQDLRRVQNMVDKVHDGSFSL